MLYNLSGWDETMMNDRTKTLAQLKEGDAATVTYVGGDGALRQHFLDMGLIPGVQVAFVKSAPMGDPMEFRIHNYELTLRRADAARIEVSSSEKDLTSLDGIPAQPLTRSMLEHPGLGEGGRYHTRDEGCELPEDTILSFALAGNQNSGKTTLFNQLTGANQHVGNFPGVTVDRKSGIIRGHPNTEITDLPGIYSMSPYTMEEVVSRSFLLDEPPSAIIDVADATSIERSLYLTLQLIELERPLVLALNMMDELQGNGGSVRVNEMEELLGIPVVPITAARNEGVDELVSHALHLARFQEGPVCHDLCSPEGKRGAVHRCLHAVMHFIEDHAERAGIPLRFAATKLVEGDKLVASQLELDENERDAIEHIVTQMEVERGLDRAAAIADMRYAYIAHVVDACVVRPQQSREQKRSQQIDRILTGKWTAIPAFVSIMALIFWLSFNVIGSSLQDLMQNGVDACAALLKQRLAEMGTAPIISSFLVDGVVVGVGTVIVFLPVIVTMFFFLSLLEDTGYMARIAFVMDKPLRRIGLSGRSIVPMLMGFGCTVPAVMAARTLPSARDRVLTILLTPFMSCSTKLAIYGFLVSAFFPGQGALVVLALYLLGIALAVVVALTSRATVFKGEAVPFVMELPNYRLPTITSVARLVWDKSKDFLTRAFSIIFVASIIVWFLSSFGPNLALVSDREHSLLAVVSGGLSPLFTPLGLGDWRIITALLAGFMAKETVVSTISELFGSTALLAATITPLAAASLLVFCLLYTPCIAAVAAIRRELGGRWAIGVVVFQCALAWLIAYAVRLVGLALGMS